MSPQLDEFDEAWTGVSALNNEHHADAGRVVKLIQINKVTLHPFVGEEKKQVCCIGQDDGMYAGFQMMS